MQDQSDTQRKRSGFRMLIGYRTKVWREGYGEVELALGPAAPELARRRARRHLRALLDVALGHAVSFCPVPGNTRYSTTVSLTTNFLKGAKGGRADGIGRIDGVEGRIATGSGEVRDADGDAVRRRAGRASSISRAASSPRACRGVSVPCPPGACDHGCLVQVGGEPEIGRRGKAQT